MGHQQRTFQHQPLALVLLEQLRRLALHRLVAVRARARHLDGLAVQLEAVHLLHGVERALLAVKHHKRLPLALERRLGNNVQHGAVVAKHARQRLLHRVDLDALLEVVDLAADKSRSANECRRRGCAMRAPMQRAKEGIKHKKRKKLT